MPSESAEEAANITSKAESPQRSKKTKKSKKPSKRKSKHSKSHHDHEDYTSSHTADQETLSDHPLVSTPIESRIDERIESSVEPEPTQSKEDGLQPRRTQSFIQSLPVAQAEPETTRVASVLAYTSEIEPITDSGRLVADTLSLGGGDQVSRPALISVGILKPSPDIKLGVSFRSIFGELKIGNIAPTSPLANTPMRPGDRLISLDHHRNTNHWTAVQAANYVRTAEGLICFVVRTRNGDSNVAEAAVYKSSVEEKVGISFRNENGRLRVSKINRSGLLGEMSVLNPGDFVETINYMDVNEIDAALALQIVRSSLGLVTFRVKNNDTTEVSLRDVMITDFSSRRFSGPIVAADELESVEIGSGFMGREHSELQIRPGFISVKVYKPTVDTKLGISFMNPDGDQLQVCNVSNNTMMTKCPIAPGMQILSIGNIRCRKWTKKQALDYVKASIGEILFILQNPSGNSSYAMAMAFKPTARSKLGISFKMTGGPLVIGSILPDGLLCNSVVNCDDAVIAINSVPCQHMTPSEAVSITQRNPDSVTLLTRPHRSNGIVMSHISNILGGDEYDNARRDVEAQHQQQANANHCSTVACIVVVVIGAVIFITIRATGNPCPYDDDYYEQYYCD
jgi:hypothetical protein